MSNLSKIALVIALTGIFAIGSAKAGWWEKVSGMVADTVPSKMFAVEAQGFNLRGYLFSPMEGRTCLFIAGEQKGGLDCWEQE